jgi:2',3'-cyclic-nucleotide 2'-phosphodiesterase (5'-nucleotidase family)
LNIFQKELEGEDNHQPFSIIVSPTNNLMSFRFLWSYLLLLFSALTACKTHEATSAYTKQYEMSEKNLPYIDSAIYNSAAIYRQQLTTQMSEVLVQSDSVMDKGLPESTLGNYVADVCLTNGNSAAKQHTILPADFIVLNTGSLRKSLPRGGVTLGDFFEVMPFENQLVILSCTGSQVKSLLDFIASKGGTPVSGIRFQMSKSKRNTQNVMINGQPFDTLSTYRIMTADYLANGGDHFDIFTKASKREEVGLKIRDALIDDARSKGKQGVSLHAKTDNRIAYVD